MELTLNQDPKSHQFKPGVTSKVKSDNKEIELLEIESLEKLPINKSGINTITIVKPQSYHISINIVINKDYKIHKIALLDTGADENCTIEGLIPIEYLEKGTTRLFSAIREKLKINYKTCQIMIKFTHNQIIKKTKIVFR